MTAIICMVDAKQNVYDPESHICVSMGSSQGFHARSVRGSNVSDPAGSFENKAGDSTLFNVSIILSLYRDKSTKDSVLLANTLARR